MMRCPDLVLLTLSLAALTLPRAARPQAPHYAITDLGTLPGQTDSDAHGLNNRGEVVGQSGDGRTGHAFLWKGRQMRDLGTLGGPWSDATGINNRGQVVGQSDTVYKESDRKTVITHAFLWENGRMRDLGTLGGKASLKRAMSGKPNPNVWFRDRSRATAINDTGQVVGFSDALPDRKHDRAFLWRSGRMTDIGRGEADAINNKGQVVVRLVDSSSSDAPIRLFLWRPGSPRQATGMFLTGAINNKGQVIGTVKAARKQHGWDNIGVWQNGRIQQLAKVYGLPVAINDHNQIVGVTSPHRDLPFLWQRDRMFLLQQLLPPNADWRLTDVSAINNRGQIVGQGLHHGKTRAFLMSPR